MIPVYLHLNARFGDDPSLPPPVLRDDAIRIRRLVLLQRL
jgi:hypothetical protein